MLPDTDGGISAVDAFGSDWQIWHDQRLSDLATPFGWLSVTGLQRLEPGDAVISGFPGTFSFDGADEVVFTPDRGGSIGLTTASLDLLRAADADERPAGDPAADGQQTDAPAPPAESAGKSADDGCCATPGRGEVRLCRDSAGALRARLGDEASLLWFIADNLVCEIIRRGERVGVRTRDSHSPLLLHFVEIPTFPLSRDWVITGRFTPFEEVRERPIATACPGYVGTARTVGVVDLEIAGEPVSLVATGSPSDGLTIDFHDETNSSETAAWRTVSAGVPDADGKVLVDFNRAVNYPFAFHPYGTCPAPVPENSITAPVTAGERRPARTLGREGIIHQIALVDLTEGYFEPQIVDWFKAGGVEVTQVRAHRGELIPAPQGIAAVLVGGSLEEIADGGENTSPEQAARIADQLEDSLASGAPVVAIGTGTEVFARAFAEQNIPGTDGWDARILTPREGFAGLAGSEEFAAEGPLADLIRTDPQTGLTAIDLGALVEAEPSGELMDVWARLIERFVLFLRQRG